MNLRLSSENVHATSVAKDGRAVLLIGPSGSGKSDLALRLIDRGYKLVSDDRTIILKDGQRLLASAPANISGKLEVRGIGIVNVEVAPDTPIALAVDLATDIERLPDDSRQRTYLSIDLPLVSINARTPSADAKVELALAHFGLNF